MKIGQYSPSAVVRHLKALIECQTPGLERRVSSLFYQVDYKDLGYFLNEYVPEIYGRTRQYLNWVKEGNSSQGGYYEVRNKIQSFNEELASLLIEQDKKIREIFQRKVGTTLEYPAFMCETIISIKPLLELEKKSQGNVPYHVLWQIASGNHLVSGASLEDRLKHWLQFVFRESVCFTHPFAPTLFEVHHLIKGVVKTMGLRDERLGIVRIERAIEKVFPERFRTLVDADWKAIWQRALCDHRLQGVHEDFVLEKMYFINDHIALFSSNKGSVLIGKDRFTLGRIDCTLHRSYGLPAPKIRGENLDGKLLLLESISWTLFDLLHWHHPILEDRKNFIINVQLRRLMDYFYLFGVPKTFKLNEVIINPAGQFFTIEPLERASTSSQKAFKEWMTAHFGTNPLLLKCLIEKMSF